MAHLDASGALEHLGLPGVGFLYRLTASFQVAVGAVEVPVELNCSSHLNTVDHLDIRGIPEERYSACRTC